MEIQQYEFGEVRMRATVEQNPFDVSFTAQVDGPEGCTRVTGFFDGEDTFAFRFLPLASGDYRYTTRSPVPELDGKTGIFHCVPAREGRHGPVRVRDRYWFAYADGTPNFEVGTTCYAWIHQSPALQQQTLDTLAQGYFNKIRMCVFPKWFDYNHREPELYPFAGNPKNGFDYDQPNIAFFRHLEEAVGKLEALGIQADMILFHPYEADHWRFNYMTEEQDRRYLRYVIARLSAYSNVWWSLANEYDLIKTGYKQKLSAWKTLLRFVRSQDPYGHLTSIHQFSRMYDHRDPNITHCSIQRTETYLTAEYTDTWRRTFGKPVVVDECAYEGNLNALWGGITARELVRRFWEATARGGYMGHGETYQGENIWWSHGGTLQGESPARIRFLRQVMERCPDIRLTCESGPGQLPRALAGAEVQLVYFGVNQPVTYLLQPLGSGPYKVEVLDTWNMTVEELPRPVQGPTEIALPGKPYLALLCTALQPGAAQPFTRDSTFEQMQLTLGGRRLLKLLRVLLRQNYAGIQTMTLHQVSAFAGGFLDGRAGDGILRIVNKNEFWRGLWQLMTGLMLRR